jgi:hypothetical protein
VNEQDYPEIEFADLDAEEVYRELHWGEDPDVELQVDDDRFDGDELTMLGEMHSITYLATKGGGELTEWVHDFHEPLPLLCVDSEGRLEIVGGAYWLAPHGIVG